MLLLHWGTGQAADWEPYGRMFSTAYHVIAPDLLGRGHSDRAADLHEYGKYESLADIEAVGAALALDDAVVIGSSFGAAMGALYAARHPEHVAALVMDDGGPPVERVVGTLLQNKVGAAASDWSAIRETFATLE